MMNFNDLILLYCYYDDLAEDAFCTNDWNWEESFIEYQTIADHIAKTLESMCFD